MNSTINSNTHSALPKSFYNGVLDILYQYATFNDVEACKDALRGHIRPYLFDYSVNQLDIAFKEINAKFDDLREIKRLYIKPSHHSFDGYYQGINVFAQNAFQT